MRRPRKSPTIQIEISPGELIDRITILEIKAARMTDPEQLDNVQRELERLRDVRATELVPDATLARLESELKSVNLALWDAEDALRVCEAAEDFGSQFIELSRSVYRNNDRRAAVKREIGALFGSRIVEEKSYKDY